MGLGTMEVIIGCEVEFDLLLPEDIAACRTPQELCNIIIRERKAKRSLTMQAVDADEDVWPRVQRVIAERLDIPMSKINRTTDLYKDLGLG